VGGALGRIKVGAVDRIDRLKERTRETAKSSDEQEVGKVE
jgi:hypothetical protein